VTEELAERIADTMFALATPSRVRILGCLRERPHTVGELIAATGMAQPAVSHQLRLLRDHRLVVAERRGRERVYALYDEHVASLLDEAERHARQLASGRRRRSRAYPGRQAGGGQSRSAADG
jgi:ArsR family transcriptional regulator, nickel/cobalt-responsive transcriptional repressor